MRKRKRESGEAHSLPSRKSVRLAAKSQSNSSAPFQQKGKEELYRSRVLLPLLPSSLAKEENVQNSTIGTSLRSNFGKTKRIYDQELRADIGSRKRARKPDPAAPKASVCIIERPKIGLGASQNQGNEKGTYIAYWAEHNSWPKEFAEHKPMASSTSSANKRPRSASDSLQRSSSYSQSRKDSGAPPPYTVKWEKHILNFGLHMSEIEGMKNASAESKAYCARLLQTNVTSIEPPVVPHDDIDAVLADCERRNEALVARDVTTLILPPIRRLFRLGNQYLEHIIDEVNCDWSEKCVFAGPRPRPDVAVGLFESAFTSEERDKLLASRSASIWANFTDDMLFPFLTIEVKCGDESIARANRQNMNSCSMAVRTILRLEQEADRHRPDEEKQLQRLSGQALVFSISHDQRAAYVSGHYAIIDGDKWTQYRYRVAEFTFAIGGLLGLHNFALNVLKTHGAVHVKRLKDALAVLPDPTTLSYAASEIALTDESRDADGFVVPKLPAGASQDSQLKSQIADFSKQIAEQNKQIANMSKQAADLSKQAADLMKQLKEKEEEREMERKRYEEREERLLQALTASRPRGNG